jgi:2-haloacid dehalogenase
MIFDPRSITAAIEMEFPGKGEELGAAWRTKAFEYCWLRTLCRNCADFWRAAEDSLAVVFATAKIELSAAKCAGLIEADHH